MNVTSILNSNMFNMICVLMFKVTLLTLNVCSVDLDTVCLLLIVVIVYEM